MSGRTLGGQKRTTICPCGFIAKGQLREAKCRFKLHTKKCELAKELGTEDFSNAPFVASVNGLNGMTYSRHGNIQHRPVVSTASTVNLGQRQTLSQAVENIELANLLDDLQRQGALVFSYMED